jgi:hypothetical protein
MKYHRPAYENVGIYHDNYSASISRRRPDSVLDYDRFCWYLDREDVFLFQENNYGKISAVIGQADSVNIDGEVFDVFKASHFAPFSMREGVKILKKMSKIKDRVVVFTVTDDLCDMLMQCGFSPVGVSFQMFWNGDEQTKTVFTQFGNETFVKTIIDEYTI